MGELVECRLLERLNPCMNKVDDGLVKEGPWTGALFNVYCKVQ